MTSELKNILLDIILPSVAVIAAGLYTYALTTGPEEYDDLGAGAGKQNDESHDPENHTLPNNRVGYTEFINTRPNFSSTANSSNDAISVPEWALEVLQKVNTIAEDTKELKEKQKGFVCSKCQKEHHPVEDTSLVAGKKAEDIPIPLETWVANLSSAVTLLSTSNSSAVETTGEALQTDAKTKTRTPLQKGCDVLIMYITNVKTQPNVPRYRKISTINASYKENLEGLVGHDALLAAVGFVKSGSYFEWTWAPKKEEGNKKASNSNSEKVEKSSFSIPEDDKVDTILSESIRLLEELRK